MYKLVKLFRTSDEGIKISVLSRRAIIIGLLWARLH